MTDQNKAPERVYGFLEPDQGGMRWEFSTHPDEADTEYVHADLHDALAKERDELQAEVERLRAEVERLREALHVFASAADGRRRKDWFGGVCFQQDVLLAARAALQRKEGHG